ncbi:MAG: UDP-N-acetylmuramyl-tripeptide synthetase, partial [Actinobacteria bacterium]|nr:UDP-N-acetylmuramyl-tripeptide synthetase [Actinomycetota bacterium]
DFHGDMSAYLAAKRRLFDDHEVGTAVINIDDEAGAEIAASHTGDLLTVGAGGDVRGEAGETVQTGTRFDLITPWGRSRVLTPVRGSFNVANALLAAACCLSSGIPFEDTVAGLERLGPVPGRFEVVSGGDAVTVIVDYAHTPRGISEAIGAARAMATGRVVALAGAGGERDRRKRPLMGRALSAADVAVVTSDNPRSENPERIVDSVLAGVPAEANVMVVVDRRQAIATALAAADDGDVVLILGRGHEPMQEAGGERVPFDDRDVAREALARLRKSADSGAESGSMGP